MAGGKWGGYPTRAALRQAVKEGKVSGDVEYKHRIAEYTRRHPGSDRRSARGHPGSKPSSERRITRVTPLQHPNPQIRLALAQVRAALRKGWNPIIVKWYARYPPESQYPKVGNRWQAARIETNSAIAILRESENMEDAVTLMSFSKRISRPEEVLQFEVEKPQ